MAKTRNKYVVKSHFGQLFAWEIRLNASCDGDRATDGWVVGRFVSLTPHRLECDYEAQIGSMQEVQGRCGCHIRRACPKEVELVDGRRERVLQMGSRTIA